MVQLSLSMRKHPARFGREIRDVRPFAAAGPSGDRPVWRISLPPARGFEIAALIEPSAQMFYDWAGGLIWIAPLPGGDAGAAMVRKAIAALGGHATLDPRACRGARRGRCVRAAACSGRGADQACQGKLRSQGRAQSGPHVGGGVMQTNFTLAQLADPHIASSEKILRACVHCGFCTATCPTYVLLGDELDSPRGRIYLIKEMLEHDRPATREVVKHIDRCLSCLACMTTCPSGVHYMHLVDHARYHIEETYRRPLVDRLMRGFLAACDALSGAAARRDAGRQAGQAAGAVVALIGLKPLAAALSLRRRAGRTR